jgi:hypothetical protein
MRRSRFETISPLETRPSPSYIAAASGSANLIRRGPNDNHTKNIIAQRRRQRG